MSLTSQTYGYIAAGLYWVLILCWLLILVFYWREHRRLRTLESIVGTMLVVVFLDGARTLLENVYFGTVYTARAGILPSDIYELLSDPQLVIVPKLINLASATVIIMVLVRQWFPAMRDELDRQRQTAELYEQLQKAHESMQAAHDELTKAHGELRRTHEELSHTHAELRAAREAQDALTHMIVHDMRTPLTSIITGLQTVQQTEYDPEITPEMVDHALTGANRLLLMVNDLLDISKMESGMMTLTPDIFPVKQPIDVAVTLVGPLAREKGITIEVRHEERDEVQADRELVRRIMVNLLGNALKYAPRGGQINVAVERSGRATLRISVSDNGPGIPPEHQSRIFDKFHQVANGENNGVPSTGLGLTFCKMAVEVLGGDIGVQSALGEGSTFYFTLPAAVTD
ncbi:MAG: HAMP domain-containing histidine kinase [Chthonomonadales bacterium]|nr:HAMP domain-containing histidine kinase [Chthonomonadales bacterium]